MGPLSSNSQVCRTLVAGITSALKLDRTYAVFPNLLLFDNSADTFKVWVEPTLVHGGFKVKYTYVPRAKRTYITVSWPKELTV